MPEEPGGIRPQGPGDLAPGRAGPKPAEFSGQGLIAMQDHRPVEFCKGPGPARCAHPGALVGAVGKLADPPGQDLQIRRRGHAELADIAVIGVHLQGVAEGQIQGAALRSPGHRYPEAVEAVPHRIAVTVPVRDQHRQARGHGLHRGDAEGLLDVVGDRNEDIGCAPGPPVVPGVSALGVEEAHGGRQGRLGVAVGLRDRFIVELPGLYADQPPPCRCPFQGLVEGGRVGLGVEGQPSREEESDVPGGEAKVPPGSLDLRRRSPQ